MVKLLSSFRKAFSWGRKKPDVGEISSQLRILAKQLARERNKLEKEEGETRARAIRARKAGQGEAFKTYATEMIRFRRLALSFDKSRLQILKILAHLNRAQTSAKTNIALQEVAKLLGMLGDATEATRLVENADEISRRLEELEIESSISSDALDASMDVSSEDLTTAMHELDVEAGLAERTAEMTADTDIGTLEEDIKELEKELGI